MEPSEAVTARVADRQDVDAFFQAAYRDLRRIARGRLHRNEHVTLLDTTGLVHECYLRFYHADLPRFDSDAECMAYAARVMRSVIVDFVRRRHAERRGSGQTKLALDTECSNAVQVCEDDLLEIEDALKVLAQAEPRLAQVVEMKYFGGFTEIEIAEAMDLTERTVRRDWNKARGLLRAALGR